MFDAKTYFGFYINLLPQALTGVNTWMNWILFLSFFMSILLYVEASLADFEANFSEICNQDDKSGDSFHKTDVLLNRTIDLHSELTKLVMNSTNNFRLKIFCYFSSFFEKIRAIVSQPLFVQAINFVVFMAFVMLTIEQNIQQFSPVTVFCFIAFFTQTLTNFVTYRAADVFTTHSLRFACIIQESQWYNLPVHQQKMLLFTIQRAIKSFILNGFGIFHVNMEVFARVIIQTKSN